MGLVIRRQREEGHAVGLGVDEWGYYETEEEVGPPEHRQCRDLIVAPTAGRAFTMVEQQGQS